jgi:hypothetical protein
VLLLPLLLPDVLLLRLLLRDTTAASLDDGACGRPLALQLPLLLLLLLPPAKGSRRGGRLRGVVVGRVEKETGRKAEIVLSR